jgi:hypothetical protein
MQQIITPEELQKLANKSIISHIVEVTIKRRYIVPVGEKNVMDLFYAEDINNVNPEREKLKMVNGDEIVDVKLYFNRKTKISGNDKDSALMKISKEIKSKAKKK